MVWGGYILEELYFWKTFWMWTPPAKIFFRPVATKGSSAVVEIISPSNAKALH